jgi:poly(3-hydroxybutyrate) depolymerase
MVPESSRRRQSASHNETRFTTPIRISMLKKHMEQARRRAISRSIMIGVCFVLALVADTAWAATASDFLYGNSASDGTGMPYRLFVPPGYNATKAYPLILFLHGAGERGNDNVAQLNNSANGAMHLLDDANLAQQPVLMIAPQCPTNGWWGGATIDTALQIVDEVEATYHIDTSRVYVTGLSMGGYGTWAATTAQPTRFAAAVQMSGGGDATVAASVSGIPFWFFHANDDPTVGVGNDDAIVSAMRDAGASVIYTRYATGGHGIWPVAYVNPLLFSWIVAQHRNAPSTSVPPLLRILQPTSAGAFATQESAIDLAGTLDNAGYSVTGLAWDRLGGSTGSVNGTTNWSVAGIALASGANLLRVTATGSSYYAGYGGVTTINDSINVNSIGPPPAAGTVVAAVNCGGADVVASDGSTYVADTGYSGGSVQVSNVPVANTTDDAEYNDWRFGTFAYHLPVYPGSYVVELHFADTYNSAAGQRKFDVLLEGVNVLHEFDIVAAAGVNTALVRRFNVSVIDGTLDIALQNGSVGNARLDAFRVIRADDAIFQDGFE